MALDRFFKKAAIALSIMSALALPVSVSAETKTFEFSSSSVRAELTRTSLRGAKRMKNLTGILL